MGKDFHAAFSNMNKAVRPGVGQPDVEKKKLTQAEKRKTMHGVQTYLSDEEYELLMLTKIKTKKKCEDILREALVQYMNVYKYKVKEKTIKIKAIYIAISFYLRNT